MSCPDCGETLAPLLGTPMHHCPVCWSLFQAGGRRLPDGAQTEAAQALRDIYEFYTAPYPAPSIEDVAGRFDITRGKTMQEHRAALWGIVVSQETRPPLDLTD